MEESKVYHVFNRGNNREAIFREEENYKYFLRRYENYLTDHVDTYAYCLMPNHFHFLIRVKETAAASDKKKPYLLPVEKAFKDFFISYSKSFNKRYNRVGSLFQYKFKRKEVNDENYLRQLVVYIHNNPVKAGLSNTFSGWKFSSYNSISNREASFVKTEEVLGWFEDKQNFEYCHGITSEVLEPEVGF